MESPTGVPERPSHKLLQKLAPSRWGKTRHIRSHGHSHAPVAHDTSINYDSHAQSEHHDISQPAHSVEDTFSKKSTPTSSPARVDDPYDRFADPAGLMLKPVILSVSQDKNALILPTRSSSANREAFVHQRQTSRSKRSGSLDHHSKAVSMPTQDEISRGFDAFDDDLLQPEHSSGVARMAGLFPAPARFSVASKGSLASKGSIRERRLPSIPTQQPDESPSELGQRGRPARSSSRAISPRNSSANLAAPKNGLIAPLSQRIQSPSRFDSSHNFTAPEMLSPNELAQLHVETPDKNNLLHTELTVDDDPESWDVIQPAARTDSGSEAPPFSLERRAEELYSAEHLEIILTDKEFLHSFSQFLHNYRFQREPILAYYLSVTKAIKALDYANTLTGMLSQRTPPYDSVVHPPATVSNSDLSLAAKEAFDELLRNDLHYYIAHTWTEVVGSLVQRRITGTLAPHLRDASTGLAEVFVITDPNREDSPIILASEMFSRHSGCSLDYIIGRNCRFLQGPCTTVDSVRRFAASNREAKDHTEIFVNYRRDGTPFLSLVMNAPLLDSYGKVRYFLGAQVDVSGLLKDCSGLDSLRRLVEQRAQKRPDSVKPNGVTDKPDPLSAMKALCETFSPAELSLIFKKHEAPSEPEYKIHDTDRPPKTTDAGRVYIGDESESDSDETTEQSSHGEHAAFDPSSSTGNLGGVYKHYILVRPAPSLRILFASPSLREPGLLQTPFLHRIGGSLRMRKDLESALSASKPVTARVRWLKTANEDGEGDGSTLWIHCTPLLHVSNQPGLWMVVLVPNKEVAGSVYSS